MTPQPEKQGKIFWLSGPPGAGKSTTCQLMARENGYVYYEADATTSFVNPFIDLEAENPSMATMQQKPVKVALLRSKAFSGHMILRCSGARLLTEFLCG